MENQNPQPTPSRPQPPAHETGKIEWLFAALILAGSIALCNFLLFGGAHLAFAAAAVALILCSAVYLRLGGHKFSWYSGALISLSAIIAAGFARSDDGFVKFVLLNFLLLSVNLGLCLLAGQNRRGPGGIRSLLDAPRALFMLGVGDMEKSARGLGRSIKNSGKAGKNGTAVALGLLISVPILLILVPLLMDADAAFEGLLSKLPKADLGEYLYSALLGAFLALILYSRGVALHRSPKPEAPKNGSFRGLNALTVGTVLAAVCLVYCVYLLSQLAYFSGGFAGILPEGFTMAEYARRGFFEMAWLCAINLTIICGSVWLAKREGRTPLFVRLCCLFLGLITLFLVATASAKMFLYIGSYGLTRLRVLTEVIMLWLGLTTIFVTVWLFVPKLPYMKAVLLTALAMGAVVLWTDVDTVVARYNVRAYQSGQLETVDIDHLATLNLAAVPYIYELTGDPDPEIAENAALHLELIAYQTPEGGDWRSWNWAYGSARDILELYRAETGEEAAYAEPG